MSFELAGLDATTSSSLISEELGSGGCEKMLGGGTMTEGPAVVDERGIRTGRYKDSRRPEDELASGTGTPYKERGSVWVGNLGLATSAFGGPASLACALTEGVRDGSGCDGEATERGTNPGGSCPSGNGKIFGALPKFGMPWGTDGIFGDEGVAKTVVGMVGDMGRFAASSALMSALRDI